ncbi:hypothetical protein OPQ81_008026 [Rhizoctonia solani]|nr:hypothetical protein OPQ81_008026 [Rhizoctonia solani]
MLYISRQTSARAPTFEIAKPKASTGSNHTRENYPRCSLPHSFFNFGDSITRIISVHLRWAIVHILAPLIYVWPLGSTDIH